MNNINEGQLTTLLEQAAKSVKESETILDELLSETSTDDSYSMEDTIYSIQLTLQYRLSCQDALATLLNFDQNLLYILGIQPQHSAKMNLERLAYALGDDDLKQLLHALSLLVNSLLKITKRYQKEHVRFELKTNPSKHTKQNALIKGMQKLISQQNHFLNLIHKLELDVKKLIEYQSSGPVFDHIAALRGPISQFHQALLHGLGKTKQLYKLINKNHLVHDKLDLLLKKGEELLTIMPTMYKAPPQHSLTQANTMSSEQLEQRATAKRLRPFF